MENLPQNISGYTAIFTVKHVLAFHSEVQYACYLLIEAEGHSVQLAVITKTTWSTNQTNGELITLDALAKLMLK